jgi:predicted extracellular nuclease
MRKKLIGLAAMAALLLPLVVVGSQPASAAPGDPLINEIQVSTSGTDWEFFELQGIPGTDLSGLTLVGIESDFGSSAGTIDLVVDLTGQSIPADGFWLGISPTGASTYGVTGELSIADNSFENSTATYFLVSGFTGSQGTDLDGDNDGVLDSTPWGFVLDSINIRDAGATDFDYGASSVGPDGSFLPSGTYRCPDAPIGDFDNNILNFSTPNGTPGAANNCATPPSEACGDAFTPIYNIQGNGLASPLDGSDVSTEGVVVGDFQDGKGGFFLQDAVGDSDMSTSDGIFVFGSSLDVNMGDRVRVRGTVDEFFSLTEITNVSLILLCSSGNSVAPTALSLPVSSPDDFEPYEGMLVTFPQALYISEFFNFDRFGEIVLTTDRQFQPTAIFEPGSPEAAQLALDNSLSRITLDDGRDSQNPDPAIHPNGAIFDLANLFRGGDIVYNVTGALDYNFGLYRIQPTQGADYVPANTRPVASDDVGGNLQVAAFNVLNYFTTIDTGAPICGPAGDQGCRGADTPEEFTRQRDKIIAALAAMDADVVGLIEIENYPGDVPTADLVSGLNTVMGAGTYAYIPTGAIGTDAIRQAMIYKPATVSPVGAFAILDSSVDSRFLDDFNRPVLAQTFQDNATGAIFTVAVNHLKSKGSDCDDIGDPDTGDGQGNCNLTRKAAAEAMVDWLATDPTGSGDGDFLIIGDLNSYDKEDPIDALLAGGYTDLVSQFGGEFAYSYVFDGQLGYLDHALANSDLLGEVTGTTVWHINADEPDLIDYDTTFKQDAQDAIYAPDAFRSSDHDPVIVGLDVCDEIAPTLAVSVSPDSLWPPNHKYVTVQATVTASDNFDTDPTVVLVSVTSNEPDNGLGDGDTANDIVIVDDYTFKLRAERSGTGDGRVYTITYEVMDICGNSTVASTTVTVPHSRRN